jgi:catechol 2,3-dioxygenase-like lactoylglutathione lyase family enzyme
MALPRRYQPARRTHPAGGRAAPGGLLAGVSWLRHRSVGQGAPMIVGIDHVQITVPANAVAEARAFYCRLLGLREVQKPAALQGRGGFWLEVGDRQVHVGTEDGVARHVTKAHVAYAVTEVAQWRVRLAAAGVKFLDGIPILGRDRIEFRDPFGNRVELIGAAAANAQ